MLDAGHNFSPTPAGCDRRADASPVSSSDIDVGLAVLRAVTPGGVAHKLEDIAEVCDCRPQVIRAIEHRALAKLRVHPERGLLRQLFDEILERDDRRGNAFPFPEFANRSLS